jgi:hypothetical protein
MKEKLIENKNKILLILKSWIETFNPENIIFDEISTDEEELYEM